MVKVVYCYLQMDHMYIQSWNFRRDFISIPDALDIWIGRQGSPSMVACTCLHWRTPNCGICEHLICKYLFRLSPMKTCSGRFGLMFFAEIIVFCPQYLYTQLLEVFSLPLHSAVSPTTVGRSCKGVKVEKILNFPTQSWSPNHILPKINVEKFEHRIFSPN